MASLQQIKSRLKAVKNIGQITKAMEVVSATKMRKAQEVALDSRQYAFKALSLLETIRKSSPGTLSTLKLLEERDIKKTLVILVASDRGLAGSFNSQVTKAFDRFMKSEVEKNILSEYVFMAIGKKAHQFLIKKGFKVEDFFEGFGDMVHRGDIAPMAETAVRGFLNNDWDRVVTISTHFHSTLKQEPITREVLPVSIEKIQETVAEIVPDSGKYSDQEKSETENVYESNTEYIFEPSPEETLKVLVPHLVNMQLYQLVLEANASEHSARMVAMKNASSNAEELNEDLTLVFNKARQAAITKEMIELSSSRASII